MAGLTEIVGFIAAALTTVAFIPQAYKVYKTKKTDDISLWMFFLFTVGILLWLVYGILTVRLPIILANAVTLFLSFYILMMKVRQPK